MINAVVTLIVAIVLFLSGYIIQAIRRIIGLITKLILTIFSFLGVNIKFKEKSIKMSQEFINTYKDIKIMKVSNKNLSVKSSIDWVNLGLFCASLLLIISNLAVVSGNAISNCSDIYFQDNII